MSIDCLRLSVTDKCNLRCVYCHPFLNCHPIEHELVSRASCPRFEGETPSTPAPEETLRIVRLFAECGIKKPRLTGGEPLLRRDIVRLVRELAAIAGIKDLSITTNGVFLESLATELKAAGLQRVNISVDSIDRKTYERITGFDLLPDSLIKCFNPSLRPKKVFSCRSTKASGATQSCFPHAIVKRF